MRVDVSDFDRTISKHHTFRGYQRNESANYSAERWIKIGYSHARENLKLGVEQAFSHNKHRLFSIATFHSNPDFIAGYLQRIFGEEITEKLSFDGKPLIYYSSDGCIAVKEYAVKNCDQPLLISYIPAKNEQDYRGMTSTLSNKNRQLQHLFGILVQKQLIPRNQRINFYDDSSDNVHAAVELPFVETSNLVHCSRENGSQEIFQYDEQYKKQRHSQEARKKTPPEPKPQQATTDTKLVYPGQLSRTDAGKIARRFPGQLILRHSNSMNGQIAGTIWNGHSTVEHYLFSNMASHQALGQRYFLEKSGAIGLLTHWKIAAELSKPDSRMGPGRPPYVPSYPLQHREGLKREPSPDEPPRSQGSPMGHRLLQRSPHQRHAQRLSNTPTVKRKGGALLLVLVAYGVTSIEVTKKAPQATIKLTFKDTKLANHLIPKIEERIGRTLALRRDMTCELTKEEFSRINSDGKKLLLYCNNNPTSASRMLSSPWLSCINSPSLTKNAVALLQQYVKEIASTAWKRPMLLPFSSSQADFSLIIGKYLSNLEANANLCPFRYFTQNISNLAASHPLYQIFEFLAVVHGAQEEFKQHFGPVAVVSEPSSLSVSV